MAVNLPVCRIITRMSSTIVGQSGRKYLQGRVLQRHPKNPELSVYQAEHTLLAEYPELPAAEVKKILRYIGEVVKEFHDKGWIHLDVKPDNILVNWTCDEKGNQVVTDAVLGDFDIAFKPEGGKPLQTFYAIGNVMWRSPEGQTARGVTKASDVFSFGLVCIYALGAGDTLVLKDYQDLVRNGIKPEQEILHRHLLYFGPLPEGLLKQIKDELWCDALKKLSEMVELMVNDEPEVRFEQWEEDIAPNLTLGAKSMISRMTNLDPAARPTIDEVLKHQWW